MLLGRFGRLKRVSRLKRRLFYHDFSLVCRGWVFEKAAPKAPIRWERLCMYSAKVSDFQTSLFVCKGYLSSPGSKPWNRCPQSRSGRWASWPPFRLRPASISYLLSLLLYPFSFWNQLAWSTDCCSSSWSYSCALDWWGRWLPFDSNMSCLVWAMSSCDWPPTIPRASFSFCLEWDYSSLSLTIVVGCCLIS